MSLFAHVTDALRIKNCKKHTEQNQNLVKAIKALEWFIKRWLHTPNAILMRKLNHHAATGSLYSKITTFRKSRENRWEREILFWLKSKLWGNLYEKRLSDGTTHLEGVRGKAKVRHLANSFETWAVVKDTQNRMIPLLWMPCTLWNLLRSYGGLIL